jgi:hypothetical protein
LQDVGFRFRADAPGTIRFRTVFDGPVKLSEEERTSGYIVATGVVLYGVKQGFRTPNDVTTQGFKPDWNNSSHHVLGSDRCVYGEFWPHAVDKGNRCPMRFYAATPNGMWQRLSNTLAQRGQNGQKVVEQMASRVRWSLRPNPPTAWDGPPGKPPAVTAHVFPGNPTWGRTPDMAVGFELPNTDAKSKPRERALGLFLEGMPLQNSGLGCQTLRLEVMSKDQQQPLLTSDRYVRVFFCPVTEGITGLTPNWYYYWAKNCGGPSPYVWDNVADDNWTGFNWTKETPEGCWAYYNSADQRMYFNSHNTSASTLAIPYMFQGYSFRFEYRESGNTPPTWVAAWRVDNPTDFANVCWAHERTHYFCERYLRRNQMPVGWQPLQDKGPRHPLDPDRDCVPGGGPGNAPAGSRWEEAVPKMNPRSIDSFKFPGKYSGTSKWRDNEFYAWVYGVYEEKFRKDTGDTFATTVKTTAYHGQPAAKSDPDKDWSVLGSNWRKD